MSETLVERAKRLAVMDKPSEEWMGAEDEREYHAALAARITELESVVEKLPKTADGKYVVPGEHRGDKVWLWSYGKLRSGFIHWEPSRGEWTAGYGHDGGCPAVTRCYSTRSAAEASKEGGGDMKCDVNKCKQC